MTDIKDVSKRIRQLSYVALIVSLFTLVLYILNAVYLSALLLGFLFISICICIILDYNGYQKYTKPILLTMVMVFIFLLSFAEGLAAGGYQYYLPLLFALPMLGESGKPFKKELLFYFAINCCAFCICVFFCPNKSSWQNISDEMYDKIFHLNTIGALLVSIIFVYFNFYFEKKYEAALVHQIEKAENAMHVRTRFLSNMGHELRTPLNGISGLINLMRKGSPEPAQQEYLKLLKYCSEQMLGLVNDVLDFNKIEVGKLELHPIVFNLKQLLHQAVLPFYYRFEEKNVEIKVQLDNELDEFIRADDLRLVQVLNNLLSNALKFTQAGQVKLVATCIAKSDTTLQVKFSVQDSGIGIDKQDQKRIFESFGQVINERTRKQEGAGLGLTISQRLLELMDSKLEVSSEPQQGSTFFFSCSFAREAAPKTALDSEKISYSLAGMRVLIAEDNPINLMIISKMLQDWQAIISTAVNGKSAIDTLATETTFDLVLLDLQMPEMDGYEAIVKIKKLYSNLPVLAFTAAFIDDTMKKELLTLGFKGYITKPFKPTELYAKLKEFDTAAL